MIIHCRFYFIDMLVFELTIMVCVATHHYSMSHGGFLFVFFCFLSLSLSLDFFSFGRCGGCRASVVIEQIVPRS